MKEFTVTVSPSGKSDVQAATPKKQVNPLLERMREIRDNPVSKGLYWAALQTDCANVGHLGSLLTKDDLKKALVRVLKRNRVRLAGEQEGLMGISMEIEKAKGRYIVYHLGDKVLVDKPQSLGVPKKVSEAMDTGVQVTATVIEARKRR